MFSAIFMLVLFSASAVIANEKVLICYYGTWATYRWGKGKFDVETIDPNLCTHLIYTFIGIKSEGTVVSLDPYLDLAENWGRGNFNKFTALKSKNPKLKTLLAVGGWNEGSAKYSIMSANAAYRQNFIQSALKMIQDHGFDGLDVDWEYPNRRDTVNGAADIDNFTQLLKELREEFDKHDLLLTAAVSSVEASASLSYNVGAISKYLDFINLMTYDMYGSWDPVTGHNAPLHSGEGDKSADPNSLYTVDMAINYWLKAGCPPEKLIMGVPFYGRTFSLTNPDVNSVRAPASGAGIAGQYTATNGFIGYNEFCQKLQTESWTVKTDEKAKVPYAIQNRNWVSYDNPSSLVIKTEYAMSLNLGGVMVWSIETDDFNGLCGEGDFPLLRTLNKALRRNIPESTTESSDTSSTDGSDTSSIYPDTTSTTEASDTSSTDADITSTTGDDTSSEQPSSDAPPTSDSSSSSPTTSAPDAICVAEGFAANPLDCSSYYMCVHQSDGSFRSFQFRCPFNLRWEQDTFTCNYPELVDCTV
uniref:chitinase n=1 Tax=Glyphodes pyloalis TaxID=1242752 RepID=A0A6G7S6Q9_GLYPY|nr:chitinase 2b [Glyphodes pyloalis]